MTNPRPFLRISEDIYKKVAKANQTETIVRSGNVWMYRPPADEHLRNIQTILFIWSELFDKPLSCFSTVIRFGSAPVIEVSHNADYYVAFEDETIGQEFVDWYEKQDFANGIFPLLPTSTDVPVYPVAYSVPTPKTSMATFEYELELTDKDIEVYKWLNKNCNGRFYRCGSMLMFESADDATLFKLTWCGND